MSEITEEKKSNQNESPIVNDEENIDVDNFDIDDLIERPRISSIPKVNLNIKKDEDNNDEEEEENFDYFENNQPLYDINLMEYGKNLEKNINIYLQMENLIIHIVLRTLI